MSDQPTDQERYSKFIAIEKKWLDRLNTESLCYASSTYKSLISEKEPKLRPSRFGKVHLVEKQGNRDDTPSSTNTLETSSLAKPHARWGKREYVYDVDRSEGNRFILNKDL